MRRVRGPVGVRVFGSVLLALGAWATASCASAPSEARPSLHVKGGEWFEQTGCTACHPVSVYGLSHPAVNAPDLTLAVEDVPARFGRSLEEFLQAPTGTMAMVLANRIRLDASGRRVAIEKLREAYRHHLELSRGARPMASH
jgi:hypothetical protein